MWEVLVITCEQVSAGHPDKICDQIADAIVSDCLRHDKGSRVAIEVLAKDEHIIIAGELTSSHKPDYPALVLEVLNRIGWDKVNYGDKVVGGPLIHTLVKEQSPDIALGVDKGGAGDQGMMYGYVRVSTKEQDLDRQILALREFGVPEKQILQEKQSGKDFERPVYRRLMKKLKPVDTLVIKSIDRLGRNYDEILEQWRIITKEKGASIVVLDMSLLDTRQGRDLTGTLIADIVLQLLSYVAQTEREFIRQRQAEGIAAAKARGVQFGRKAKDKPSNYALINNEWAAGERSAREAAKALNVAPSTFLRWTHDDHVEKCLKKSA